MATQQSIVFAETIRAMKLAMRRRDNDSDSDESIQQPTNRGNKLKRNASHVREGRLDTTGGRWYKRKVNHAGYQRYIIQPNPLRYDQDGDLIDEEDDVEAADLSPNEDNPFSETRLEELLAPLTSAAELSEHPSMSVPFTSNALSEMAEKARESLHREREILWSVKQLLLRFRGDDPWVPVGKLETDHDILLLDPNAATTASHSIANDTDSSIIEPAMSIDEQPIPHLDVSSMPAPTITNGHGPGNSPHEIAAHGVESTDMATEDFKNTLPARGEAEQEQEEQQQDMVNGQPTQPQEDQDMANADHIPPPSPPPAEDAASSTDSTDNQTQHRMTTRARARTPPSPAQNNSPSPSPAPSSIPPIHGFFHFPSVALPDRDFGLPTSEAEETRRLLILFVQKQDQVVREGEQLLERLLKADRMRHDVYRWSKAEAHVGELSDGEDWYDKEEWKLDGDLLKGKEEEEIEEEGRGKGRRRRGAQH